MKHNENPQDGFYSSVVKASCIFFKSYPNMRQFLTQYPKSATGVLGSMETVIVIAIATKPKNSQVSPAIDFSTTKKRHQNNNKEKHNKTPQAAKKEVSK